MAFLESLQLWLKLAIPTTVLLVLGFRYLLRPLLPHQRQRAVPWSGMELIVGLILVLIFWPAAVSDLLDKTGIYPRPSGDTEEVKVLQTRRETCLLMIAFPLQVLTLLSLLYALSGTRPYQLGLTLHRFGRNALLGALGAVVFSPFVYVLKVLVDWCYAHLAGGTPQEHPLTVLGLTEPWVILVPAVVVAPILEEIVFRGLLQRWLLRRPWGGDAAMIGAGVMAVLTQLNQTYALASFGWQDFFRSLSPLFFVLLMTPPFLLLRRAPRYPTASTIYAVALLFGAAHSFAWPQPVPLFVLGLGLGYFAYRTQSLIPGMVMHALFNSIACVALLVLFYTAPEKGKDLTTQLPAPPATSSAVPACWWPRRM